MDRILVRVDRILQGSLAQGRVRRTCRPGSRRRAARRKQAAQRSFPKELNRPSRTISHHRARAGENATDPPKPCGPFTATISTFNHFPDVRFLLNFARIFLPIKHLFSYSLIGRTNFIPSARSRRMSSRCCTSKCFFLTSFLNFLIEEVLFGWCRCQLFRIHGSWVYEISWSPAHGYLHRRFCHSELPLCFSPSLPCASTGQV